MSALFDLTGKTAVVTGSTKGIGKAIARALAQHGARVVVSSRDEGRVEATARALTDEGLAVLGLTCNVGRKAELERLIEESRKALGQIDIVVGNAAINPHYGSFADISDDAFAKIMATNVQSNLWLA
ncbi:MAG: SDR family NAD(P)-dependent oxidoreductase, partial [Rhodospirillaceae bacterium]|nr:SDR family NAD(P)-dependent oxidoreductase [Rhodospirillaceae bacterium]